LEPGKRNPHQRTLGSIRLLFLRDSFPDNSSPHHPQDCPMDSRPPGEFEHNVCKLSNSYVSFQTGTTRIPFEQFHSFHHRNNARLEKKFVVVPTRLSWPLKVKNDSPLATHQTLAKLSRTWRFFYVSYSSIPSFESDPVDQEMA
jgi:hypothetical protein